MNSTYTIVPANGAKITHEGYLLDSPVVSKVAVYHYPNEPPGRQSHLIPLEEASRPETLESYKGKPIVISHDAGQITTENVLDEIIGTITSAGRVEGDNIIVDVVIYKPEELKQKHVKELSIFYQYEPDETAGEWNGEPYDLIQRNLLINNLAVVAQARAGHEAKLNYNGKEKVMEEIPVKVSTEDLEKLKSGEATSLTISAENIGEAIGGKGENADGDEKSAENEAPSAEEIVQQYYDKGGIDGAYYPEGISDEDKAKLAEMYKNLDILAVALKGSAGNSDESPADDKTIEESDEEAEDPAEESKKPAEKATAENGIMRREKASKVATLLGIDPIGKTTATLESLVLRKKAPTFAQNGKTPFEKYAVFEYVASEVLGGKHTVTNSKTVTAKYGNIDAQKKAMAANGTKPELSARDQYLKRLKGE